MHPEGAKPRTPRRPPWARRRAGAADARIGALEAAWHDAHTATPAACLHAAVAFADALHAAGHTLTAAGMLAQALVDASTDDPAFPHAAMRLGDLAFAIGRLDDARRGYAAAIPAGVTNARAIARHALFLEASGHHREALRHFSVALLDEAGPREIDAASRVFLDAAETTNDEFAVAWARAAREGFTVVRDLAAAERAGELLRELRAAVPEAWASEHA
jgi:tetratricopeptide (TPR) repeat protein